MPSSAGRGAGGVLAGAGLPSPSKDGAVAMVTSGRPRQRPFKGGLSPSSWASPCNPRLTPMPCLQGPKFAHGTHCLEAEPRQQAEGWHQASRGESLRESTPSRNNAPDDLWTSPPAWPLVRLSLYRPSRQSWGAWRWCTKQQMRPWPKRQATTPQRGNWRAAK